MKRSNGLRHKNIWSVKGKNFVYKNCSFLARSSYMNHEFLYYCRCSLSPTGGLFATVGCLKFQIQINLRSLDCTNEKYFYLMIFLWYVFPGRENEVFRNTIAMKSLAIKYMSIPKNKYLLSCISTILGWLRDLYLNFLNSVKFAFKLKSFINGYILQEGIWCSIFY